MLSNSLASLLFKRRACPNLFAASVSYNMSRCMRLRLCFRLSELCDNTERGVVQVVFLVRAKLCFHRISLSIS